ncbi:MAG: hypothetical protein AAB402_04350 [Patescibacteria group bacterium]
MKTSKATVRFSINLRQDATNWVRLGQMKRMQYGRSLADFTREIPAPVLKRIRSLPRAKAITYVHKYLLGRQDTFMVDLRAMKVFLEQYMKQYGSGLLNEVAKLTDRPLYRRTFYATFTLLHTCPYDVHRHWFMISAKQNMAKQVKTIAHEIFHLQFIHYYYEYCLKRGLSETQFQDLKEALTVLLNEPRFRKFHIALDVGYPAHVKLRKAIQRLWKKKKSFATFLDACIVATKRNA